MSRAPTPDDRRHLDSRENTKRLAALAVEIKLPADAPRPEEIIRQERDRRLNSDST